jgi:hypothetical protein
MCDGKIILILRYQIWFFNDLKPYAGVPFGLINYLLVLLLLFDFEFWY